MAVDNLPVGTIVNAAAADFPEFARRYVNLASADFGAKVLKCSDEFFASADRMLQSSEPVFVVGKFDHHGKWMDGWETRRKRGPGHDTAVIRRSEEHTSELQSREKLVCRLLREKKKKFVRNIL